MKPWKLLKTDEKYFNIAFGLLLDTTRKIFNQSFLQPSVVLFQKERKCFSKLSEIRSQRRIKRKEKKNSLNLWTQL